MLKPTLVDLFSGIGIGSLGFVRAGFKIVAAVDNDPAACEIYKENLGVEPIVGDLKRISGSEILKRIGLKRGELALCVGCPPCQGFSTLRRTRRKKRSRDRRKSLLRTFAQRIKELLPRVVILENVSGLASGDNKRFLRDFVSEMHELGYSCDFRVLDSADFGVPQHRYRLVLIGSRTGSPLLPEPTHSNPNSLDGKLPWKTVRDAIEDLHFLESGQKDSKIPLHESAVHSESALQMIRLVPHDGGGRRSLPRRLWLPCHKRLTEKRMEGAGTVYGRMRWDAPSPTITTRCNTPSCGRFVHPTQDRAITLREAARLQSIPDDYRISGSRGRIAMWIGNAMPVDLAEAMGHQALCYV